MNESAKLYQGLSVGQGPRADQSWDPGEDCGQDFWQDEVITAPFRGQSGATETIRRLPTYWGNLGSYATFTKALRGALGVVKTRLKRLPPTDVITVNEQEIRKAVEGSEAALAQADAVVKDRDRVLRYSSQGKTFSTSFSIFDSVEWLERRLLGWMGDNLHSPGTANVEGRWSVAPLVGRREWPVSHGLTWAAPLAPPGQLSISGAAHHEAVQEDLTDHLRESAERLRCAQQAVAWLRVHARNRRAWERTAKIPTTVDRTPVTPSLVIPTIGLAISGHRRRRR